MIIMIQFVCKLKVLFNIQYTSRLGVMIFSTKCLCSMKQFFICIFFLQKPHYQLMSLSSEFRFTSANALQGSLFNSAHQQHNQWKTQNVLTAAQNYTQGQPATDKNFLEMQYLKFFQGLQNDIHKIKIQQLSKETLERHKIKIITNQSGRLWKKLIDQGHSYVQLASSRHNGLQCQYHVFIGKFFLTVKVLNLHRNSEESINNNQYIGQGSFGVVKRLKIDNNEFALKKISFPKIKKTQINLNYIINPDDYADCHQIRRAISQYCLYKICSMLKIGPQIYFEDFYDLICYNDGVEFHMQLCEQIDSKIDIKAFQRDIKRCLNTLHSLQIIHKDVKKQNTLYSSTFKSYVLSDFGLTHSVNQAVWQKTQTYFGGSPTHASPQMKKLLFSHETGYVNLYFNDIHGLMVTLRQLETEQSFQQFSRNSMSMGEDYYEYQEEFIEENSRQNEIFQQIAEESIMTSTSYVQGSLHQSGFNYTASTCNTESQLSADRVNYFQIKALYRYLAKFPKNGQEHCRQIIQAIIDDIIKDQTDNKTLKIQVLRFIIPIITNFNGELLEVTNIRNCIRMFGLNSQQTRKQLVEINFKRSIPYVNYNQLQNYLTMISKCNKFVIKKFKNHILNMDRHVCLRNRRSFISSLQILMANYLTRGESKEEERMEILSMGVEAMSFQGLSEVENIGLVSLLWRILENKSLKTSQIDTQSCQELVNKIFQFFQSKKKMTEQLLQSVLKVHIQYGSSEYAEYFYNKVKNNRIILQNKLISCEILENQQLSKLKNSILKHTHSQVSYLSFLKQNEKALELSKINYIRFIQFQAEDSSMKINILDHIISTLTQLNRHDEAEIYNNQLIEEVSKSCLPKNSNAQFVHCFFHKGNINMARRDYEEALKSFEAVIDCANDSLRGPNLVKIIKQSLINISTCYIKLNQPEYVLNYLEKALEISLKYEYFQFQNSTEIIHHIIIWLLKLQKCDRQLAAYFDQLAHLKIQFMKTQKSVNQDLIQKFMPFFPMEKFVQEQIEGFPLLLAKKTMVTSIEPYLPRFQFWYIRICEELTVHFQKEERSVVKALPYFWKIFKCLGKSDRTSNIFSQMGFYVESLIKSGSSRRASKFLKKYAHQIPAQYQNLKGQAYKILNKLTSQLNEKDHSFYNFVWSNKSMRNKDYFDESLDKIQQMDTNKFVKKLWQKKLNMLKPQMIQFQQEQEYLSTSSESQSSLSQDSSGVQSGPVLNANDLIAKKLASKGYILKIL